MDVAIAFKFRSIDLLYKKAGPKNAPVLKPLASPIFATSPTSNSWL